MNLLGIALQNRPVNLYPQLLSTDKGTTSGDIFNREDVTPTGAYTLYSTSTVGTGTYTTTIGSQRLALATSAALNDANSIRTSGYMFRNNRMSSLETAINGTPSQLVVDIPFAFSSTTDVQLFIGLLASQSGLTALPTTTRHLGIYVDTSVDSNIRLSSANGTTQVTTNTNTAISVTNYDIRLTITGADTATIQLINSTTQAVVSTQTVTSIQNGGFVQFELHVFLKTIGAAGVKNVDWRSWLVTYS